MRSGSRRASHVFNRLPFFSLVFSPHVPRRRPRESRMNNAPNFVFHTQPGIPTPFTYAFHKLPFVNVGPRLLSSHDTYTVSQLAQYWRNWQLVAILLDEIEIFFFPLRKLNLKIYLIKILGILLELNYSLFQRSIINMLGSLVIFECTIFLNYSDSVIVFLS